MTLLDWQLDSDPAIRWQVLRDLVQAPVDIVAQSAHAWHSRAGARVCRMCRAKTASGREAPAFRRETGTNPTTHRGSPGPQTLPTLQLLYDFGVYPRTEFVRRAVECARYHCRWEHAGQPFFDGEAEPCINGRTMTLGTYFGQPIDGIFIAFPASNWKIGVGTAMRNAARFVPLSRPRSMCSRAFWLMNVPGMVPPPL